MKAILAAGYGLLITAGLHMAVAPSDPWAQRLGWTLLHSLWQVTLIALLAKVIFVSLQRMSAQARYLVGVMCLGLTLVLPVVTWSLVTITTEPTPAGLTLLSNGLLESDANNRMARPHDAEQAIAVSNPALLAESTGRPGSGLAIPSEGNGSAASQKTGVWIEALSRLLRPWLGLVVSAWIIGVLLAAIRPLLGLWTQWRLQHRGLSPVSNQLHQQLQRLAQRLGIGVAVRIAESTLVSVPMVVGYLRPIVLLPASVLTGLTPAQLESLLAHELAHVRRHDWIVNALQVVIETLLFFHPAVWWLSCQIRHERELCCDDLAISVIGDKLTYGRMLLTLEELRQPVPLAGLSATGGDLSVRIRRLLPARAVEQSSGRGRLAGVLLLGLLAAGFVVIPALVPVDAEQQLPTVKPTVEHVEPVVNRGGTDVMRIGSVLRNRDNIPIAGADVVLSLENTVDGQNQTHFVAAATTNALGKYLLGVPEEYRKYCLPNTKFIVWAMANSYGVTIVKIGVGNELAETAPPVRAQTVTIKVADREGRPVTGQVTRLDLSNLQIPPQFVKRMVSTREDGLIEIQHMSRMPEDDERGLDQRTLWLQTKDLGLQSFRWRTSMPHVHEGEQPVELTAQPLGTIRGQLVTPEGSLPTEVLGQTQIELETFNGDSSFKTPWCSGHVTATTNAAGQFELQVAAGKLMRVRTKLPEGSRWKALLENRDITFVPPGETLAINVPLVATRRLHGAVLQVDGKGVPEIEFLVGHGDIRTIQLEEHRRSTQSAYNESVITDAKGEFAIDVIPGDVSLVWQFEPGGHIGTSELWPDREVQPIKLKDGGLMAIPGGQEDFEIPTITLTPYTGKLLDEAGQPMEGVLRVAGMGRGMTMTTSDGAFSLNVLGQPTEWIAARKGETVDFGLPRETSSNMKVISQSPLVLQMASKVEPEKASSDTDDAQPVAPQPQGAAPAAAKPSWSVMGRVLDATGKPVEGALVSASTGMGSLFTTGSAMTDAQGHYEFQFSPGFHLEDDDVQLQFASIIVRKAGYFEKNLSRQGDLLMARKLPEKLAMERRTKDDVIVPGQPRKLDFVLLPAARLAGTLIDESNKPLVGYGVSLTGPDLTPSSSVIGSTKTDDKGHFELTEIPTTFKYQILVEPAKREPPWNAWASGPYEFHFSGGDEFFIQQKGREVAANRFELKVRGPGLSWRKALEAGPRLETLQPTGDYLTSESRLHAAVLQLELNSEAPARTKPEGSDDSPRKN